MRLGVMGGTFDPPHIGHLVAASEVLHAFDLDQVLFVPTGHPWQKQNYSSGEDRFLMTTLGAAHHPSFAVSRMELDRSGPTYTRDTMSTLATFYGEAAALYFIVGADAAQRLGTWVGIEELGRVCEIVAVSRPGFEHVAAAPVPGWPRIHRLEMPGIDISASALRARVAEGRPIDFLVPPPVVRYIEERRLYREPGQEAAHA